MRVLHSLASFQFTAWLPFCDGEIGLVPRGWFSVNPCWLVVILSININLQICWRKIAKAPNAKKIMPKAEKNIILEAKEPMSSSNLLFKSLLIEVDARSCLQGEDIQIVKVKGFWRSWGERGGAFVNDTGKPQGSQRGDSLGTCTNSVPFPNRQDLPPSRLSPFCLQALEATLAFLIRQFGCETSLFGLRDKNKNVSDQNFHIWSQMIDKM